MRYGSIDVERCARAPSDETESHPGDGLCLDARWILRGTTWRRIPQTPGVLASVACMPKSAAVLRAWTPAASIRQAPQGGARPPKGRVFGYGGRVHATSCR